VPFPSTLRNSKFSSVYNTNRSGLKKITINHYIALFLTNIRIIKLRKRALQGHILDMEESRNACRISDANPEEKTPPGRIQRDNTEREKPG
jgi:hypothetical protein